MSEKNKYAPTIADEIIALLKDNDYIKNRITRFIYGRPDDVPESALPCMSFKVTNSDIRGGATQTDKIVQTIEVRVYVNKKEDFGNPDDEVTGTRTLEELVEGIDITTGRYNDNTICGVLRKYLSINNKSTNQDMRVEYEDVPRGEKFTTGEALIVFTVDRIIQVPVRT